MSVSIQFRDVSLEAQLRMRLDSDASPGKIAARDLARYYTAIDAARLTLGLSDSEALVIVDSLSRTRFREHGWQTMWTDVDEACRRDGIGRRHGLSDLAQTELVRKMREWSMLQRLACCDAIERFWANDGATVRSVGLVS